MGEKMTPEIKQRIEQIRRGEVPEGYRYIRNSICPIDWTMKRVGDCIEEYREISNDIQSFPVYSSSRKGLVLQSEYYDQKKTEETNLGYKIVPNGYVTYRHMSDDDVFHFNINQTGGAILVSSEYPVFTSANGVAIGFLIPALNDTVRFRYFCRTQKLGGTRTRLYLKNLSQYRLSVPCFQEQQKIAAILTTQDKVIELKEKRLVEKQRQKKYLMQQLLTGKKRLPGFSGEWTDEELSNFCEFVGGGTPDTHNQLFWNGSIPWISSADLVMDDFKSIAITRFITQQAVKFTGAKLCPKGCILLVSRVGVGKIAIAPTDLCTSQDFTNIIQHKHNSLFLLYALYYLMRKNVKQTQGSAIKGITVKEIKNFSLKFPTILEQTAIAEVLTAADREIDLLRQEIEQEKQKKKALMQLLLTGIVRVNDDK